MGPDIKLQDMNITFLIKNLDRNIGHLYETIAKEDGLDEVTISNGRILGYLYHHKGQDVFQKDFEDVFCINRSSVATSLKLMEKKGYVERTSMDSDARRKKVKSTPLGEEKHRESMKCIRKLEETVNNTLSESELSEFKRLTIKILEGLQK